MNPCNYNYNITLLGIFPDTLIFFSKVALDQEGNIKSFAVGNRKLNYIIFDKIVGENVFKYIRCKGSEPKNMDLTFYLNNRDRLMIIHLFGDWANWVRI